MNTTLTSACRHLGLGKLISLLADNYQPLSIFCFAARRQRFEYSGCFAPHSEDDASSFYLLMVTEQTRRIEHEVQEWASHQDTGCAVSIVVHGIATVEAALQKGSRFFITVYREGALLYQKPGSVLPPLYEMPSAGQRAVKAKACLSHRSHLAGGFLQGAETCMELTFYQNAIFMLHQAMEQTCSMLVRVCTGYRCDIHSISRLLALCGCVPDAPGAQFTADAEGQRLLSLLQRSYTEGRYQDTFSATEQDSVQLINRVSEFMEQAEKICLGKIKAFEEEAALSAPVEGNV